MSLIATRHSDADAFLAAAEPFLLRQEALHGLVISVAHAQRRQASSPRRRPVAYWTVQDSGEPVLAALTASTKLLLAADAGNESAAATLATALAQEANRPAIISVFAIAPAADAFAGGWRDATGQQPSPGPRQRLYVLTMAQASETPPGRLRGATVADAERLGNWLVEYQQETFPHEASDHDAARLIVDGLLARKDLFVWDAGQADTPRPVSMAALARPTPNGIALNLVYTPPAERRRGYATACVAALSRQSLDAGRRFCTLLVVVGSACGFLTRVGFYPLADFAEYRFATGPEPG